MNENEMQESLTNVIAEGRSYKGIPVPYAPARAIWLDDFNSFLDRIEAAYKRDIEKLNSVIQATVSRSDAEIDRLRREVAELRKQIGNAAKLREALVKIREIVTADAPADEVEIANIAYLALANPPMSKGVGLAGRKRFYSMPELGITFHRVASPRCVRLTAYFQSLPKPGCGKPDKNCDHVYEVRIDRDMSVSPPLWVARAYVDGTMSFTVFAVGRWKCELLALSAFKGYLHRVLRKSRRNYKAKEENNHEDA